MHNDVSLFEIRIVLVYTKQMLLFIDYAITTPNWISVSFEIVATEDDNEKFFFSFGADDKNNFDIELKLVLQWCYTTGRRVTGKSMEKQKGAK